MKYLFLLVALSACSTAAAPVPQVSCNADRTACISTLLEITP